MATGQQNLPFQPENSSNKDASGGYVGLTLFKINFRNAANSFTSFIRNTSTAARDYFFGDRDGEVYLFARQTMGDTNTVFSAGKTIVAQTIALTAARTLTLPAANSFTAGTPVYYVDEIGTLTGTNTVTLTPAGSDTLNGVSSLILNSPYTIVCLISDGVSKYTVQASLSHSEGTRTPTITGFSSNPTGLNAEYVQDGGWATEYITYSGNGTSNATTKTVTLQFAAANTGIQIMPIRTIDNGTSAIGYIATRVNSNVADLYPTSAGGNWTASGSCRFSISSFKYKIAT